MSEKLQILEKIFGDYKKIGEEYLFFCPNKDCQHHKPKLSINIEKNKYKCWLGCRNVGNNLFSLILFYGNKSHVQQWKEFNSSLDLEDFDSLFFNEKVPVSKISLKLPSEYIPLATNKLGMQDYDAMEYLAKRGIDESDIIKWRIGYCRDGSFYKRIVFPSFAENGELNFFCTRDYSNKSKYSYINSVADKNIIFNEININWNKPITITEGVIDSIKSENSVPILGKSLMSSSFLFKKILENKQDVYLGLDVDADNSSEKIIKKMLDYGLSVRKIDIEPYKDLGEMSKEEVEYRKKHATEIANKTDFLKFMILSKL